LEIEDAGAMTPLLDELRIQRRLLESLLMDRVVQTPPPEPPPDREP
jgi:hypothetical protein